MKTFAYLLVACALILAFGGNAMAQEITPMVQKGTEELGLSGTLDFEGPQGGVDWFIQGSYGKFFSNFLEGGGFASYTRANDGDVHQFTAGLFSEYHFLVRGQIREPFIPYVGANLGLLVNDNDNADSNIVGVFTPKFGFKWFIRDYLAIDTNLFVDWATDDIYVNDKNTDDYNIGMLLGLRIYLD